MGKKRGSRVPRFKLTTHAVSRTWKACDASADVGAYADAIRLGTTPDENLLTGPKITIHNRTAILSLAKLQAHAAIITALIGQLGEPFATNCPGTVDEGMRTIDGVKWGGRCDVIRLFQLAVGSGYMRMAAHMSEDGWHQWEIVPMDELSGEPDGAVSTAPVTPDSDEETLSECTGESGADGYESGETTDIEAYIAPEEARRANAPEAPAPVKTEPVAEGATVADQAAELTSEMTQISPLIVRPPGTPPVETPRVDPPEVVSAPSGPSYSPDDPVLWRMRGDGKILSKLIKKDSIGAWLYCNYWHDIVRRDQDTIKCMGCRLSSMPGVDIETTMWRKRVLREYSDASEIHNIIVSHVFQLECMLAIVDPGRDTGQIPWPVGQMMKPDHPANVYDASHPFWLRLSLVRVCLPHMHLKSIYDEATQASSLIENMTSDHAVTAELLAAKFPQLLPALWNRRKVLSKPDISLFPVSFLQDIVAGDPMAMAEYATVYLKSNRFDGVMNVLWSSPDVVRLILPHTPLERYMSPADSAFRYLLMCPGSTVRHTMCLILTRYPTLVQYCDLHGHSALNIALVQKEDTVSTVGVLLDRGATVGYTDESDRCAFDYARDSHAKIKMLVDADPASAFAYCRHVHEVIASRPSADGRGDFEWQVLFIQCYLHCGNRPAAVRPAIPCANDLLRDSIFNTFWRAESGQVHPFWNAPTLMNAHREFVNGHIGAHAREMQAIVSCMEAWNEPAARRMLECFPALAPMFGEQQCKRQRLL